MKSEVREMIDWNKYKLIKAEPVGMKACWVESEQTMYLIGQKVVIKITRIIVDRDFSRSCMNCKFREDWYCNNLREVMTCYREVNGKLYCVPLDKQGCDNFSAV